MRFEAYLERPKRGIQLAPKVPEPSCSRAFFGGTVQRPWVMLAGSCAAAPAWEARAEVKGNGSFALVVRVAV